MRWTPAQIAELEKFARWGFTGQEIADRMDMTRNQVIGKAWREGIVLGEGESPGERMLRGMEYKLAVERISSFKTKQGAA